MWHPPIPRSSSPPSPAWWPSWPIPIRVGRRVVGVLNVESSSPLTDQQVEESHVVALGHAGTARRGRGRAPRLRAPPAGPLEHRAVDAHRRRPHRDGQHPAVVRRSPVCRRPCSPCRACATCSTSRPSRARSARRCGTCPVTCWPSSLADIEHVSSCMSSGDDDGLSKPAMAMLREAGASSIAAFPVRSSELGHGLLDAGRPRARRPRTRGARGDGAPRP